MDNQINTEKNIYMTKLAEKYIDKEMDHHIKTDGQIDIQTDGQLKKNRWTT